mmetsp:Transcript_2647/g.5941  ORF Transcript_2647/g.5941 Transcript_2647/m.5941 type:complete len:82 (-) Transcript_2647:167-412(-)
MSSIHLPSLRGGGGGAGGGRGGVGAPILTADNHLAGGGNDYARRRYTRDALNGGDSSSAPAGPSKSAPAMQDRTTRLPGRA